MKPLSECFTGVTLAAVTGILLVASPVHAAKPEPGPNGGKLVGAVPVQAELLISPEGIATITFLDAEKKPATPGDRTAALIAQPESGRKTVELERKGDAFVAKEPLPKPEGYILVIQTRSAPGAKPTNTRVKYDMQVCGGCKLREYACTCESH